MRSARSVYNAFRARGYKTDASFSYPLENRADLDQATEELDALRGTVFSFSLKSCKHIGFASQAEAK